MEQIKTISQGVEHSAINLGRFDQLINYSYNHPKRHQEIKGKIFVGEILKATGAEVSFAIIPPHTEIPFLHQHQKHEEIYVVIKGNGQFQVNESVFDITEGCVIRVSTKGRRSYRNNSDSPLIFMCIQCMENSMDNLFVEDGLKANGAVLWSKD
jgi:mannose-6-phosphate isomerase-like protein (cupin superfamily)